MDKEGSKLSFDCLDSISRKRDEVNYWRDLIDALWIRVIPYAAPQDPLLLSVQLTDFNSFVRCLNTPGVNLEVHEFDGMTPLAMTCLCRWKVTTEKSAIAFKMTERLIKAGANVNCRFQVRRSPTVLFSNVTPIALAASQGDFNLVRLLLQNGADSDVEVLPVGATPLFLASVKGFAGIVDCLLRMGADINRRDAEGNTALIVACAALSSESVVKVLLCQNHSVMKVDVNATNRRGCSALHAAVVRGVATVVEFLLKFGADVNAETADGYTPLDLANIFDRGCGKMKKLITANGGVSKQTINKRYHYSTDISFNGFSTALHEAAFRNNISEMEVILAKGGDVNIRDVFGRTALFRAVEGHSLEAVKLLLKHNIQVDAQCNGFTALLFAITLGLEFITELILGSGANTDILYSSRPYFPRDNISLLHVVTALPFSEQQSSRLHNRYSLSFSKRLAKMLITKFVPFDGEDHKGEQPIDWAIRLGNTKVEEILNLQQKLFSSIENSDITELDSCVKKGAIVNCRSCRYKTPLVHAITSANDATVTRLIDHGADVNFSQPDDGTAALDYAVRLDRTAVVYELLSRGATLKAGVCEQVIDGVGDAKNLLNFVKTAFDSAKTGLVGSHDLLELMSKATNAEGHTVSSLLVGGKKSKQTQKAKSRK